ncbi:MAG: glycosyltransferase family 2 protein [Candidatus Roizmanbacteria bacterium]
MVNSQNTLISVIIPAYNAEKYIRESVASIQHQTYQNIEIIIIDDASMDETYRISKQLQKKDNRIRIFQHTTRKGPAQAVNTGWTEAIGTFIARMDADDIAFPNRLENQLDFLQHNPDHIAVGGTCIMTNEEGAPLYFKHFPETHKEIYRSCFIYNPLQEGTTMINRCKLPKDYMLFQTGVKTGEGVDLVFRLFRYGKVHNLNDYMIYYRLHHTNTSHKARRMFFHTLKARIRGVILYGYIPSIGGVIATLAQTILFVLLPEKAVTSLYKTLRYQSDLKSTISIRHQLPAHI